MLDTEIKGMSRNQLFELTLGPIRWQLIEIGFELDLFDALAPGKSVYELAKELKLQATKLQILLDALCGLRVLKRQGSHYDLYPSVAPYLKSESKSSMRPMLMHLSRSRHTAIERVIDCLKTGQSKGQAMSFFEPEFWDRAMPNLKSFHASLSNEVALDILLQLPEWGSVNHFLDLGAGSTCLVKSLHDLYHDLSLTVFDLPACAAKLMGETQPLSRISVIGGDYNHDSLGQGYDVIWCSMALYYAEDLLSLMQIIKRSLNERGIFISLHEGLTDRRTQPEHHVIGRFIPALNGNDVSFSKGEIADCMRKVGFNRIASKTVHTDYGDMELDIAYQV